MNIRSVAASIFTARNKSPLTHPRYRPDIDGLRAIAVLAVVMFHLFPSWGRSGFVGVDIFFVISGFLISTILLENLNRGRFSFLEFYSRRICRIFPALIVVLLASLVTGWCILFKDEYQQLTRHILAAAGFVSNIVLWGENSYFDNAIHTKPLMHLWSLAIEEQFYILWPLCVYLIYKWRLNFLLLTVLVGSISFALNISGVHRDVVAAFYSPFTRFWELLAGAALAQISFREYALIAWLKQKLNDRLETIWFAEPPKTDGTVLRNVQSILGAALVASGILYARQETFPGWWALAPTLGTALLIDAGSAAWVNRVILSQKPLIWVGLISYPLYLWHWPLLSFAQIYYAELPPAGESIAILALSLLLAWATYQWVEKPVRYKSKPLHAGVLVGLLIAIAVVAGLRFRPDLPNQRPDVEAYAHDLGQIAPPPGLNRTKKARYNITPEDCDFYNPNAPGNYNERAPRDSIAEGCYTRDPAYSKSVLIWGDSHAKMLYSGLKNNLPADWQILMVASSSCVASTDPKTANRARWCERSNGFALQTIEKVKPDAVIVAQANGHSTEHLKKIADMLTRAGVKRTVFTGPAPQWKADLPRIVVRRLWATKPQRTFTGMLTDLFDKNETLKREFAENDMIYVDILGLFCNTDGCLVRLGDDLRTTLTSYDTSHLSTVASDYLAKTVLVRTVVGDY